MVDSISATGKAETWVIIGRTVCDICVHTASSERPRGRPSSATAKLRATRMFREYKKTKGPHESPMQQNVQMIRWAAQPG